MSAFVIDLESLEDVIDRIAAFERDLDERLDEVDQRAMRLQASWAGAAADGYAQAHRDWLRWAREMHAALATMRRIATTAHGNYSAAFDANRRMWAQVV